MENLSQNSLSQQITAGHPNIIALFPQIHNIHFTSFHLRTHPLSQIESKINPTGTEISISDNLGSELMAHFNYEIIWKSRTVSG